MTVSENSRGHESDMPVRYLKKKTPAVVQKKETKRQKSPSGRVAAAAFKRLSYTYR